MTIEVNASVVIPDGDLSLSFVRGSGPGGQNVNKVASAVQLRFDLDGTVALTDAVKSRLRGLAPDGRFFIIRAAQAETGSATAPTLILVQNWTEELKRLVPSN